MKSSFFLNNYHNTNGNNMDFFWWSQNLPYKGKKEEHKMDDEKYLNDFQIVALAGSSRSKSMLALKEAKKGNFSKAEEYMKEAEDEMNQAHDLQFKMLQKEANNEPVDITIVTIHGQDHLSMATVTYDLVNEMIDILKNK